MIDTLVGEGNQPVNDGLFVIVDNCGLEDNKHAQVDGNVADATESSCTFVGYYNVGLIGALCDLLLVDQSSHN